MGRMSDIMIRIMNAENERDEIAEQLELVRKHHKQIRINTLYVGKQLITLLGKLDDIINQEDKPKYNRARYREYHDIIKNILLNDLFTIKK